MADYYAPTVVQQTIPNADMTPLELFLLSNVFSAEADGDGWYFFAEESPSDMIDVRRIELAAALEASKDAESEANAYIESQLAEAPADASEIELDFSIFSWEFLLRSIVRRSPTLPYIAVVTSFTCSKMRADGFGGTAMLITADKIMFKSTEDILHAFMDEAEFGPLGTAPGFGVHVLLRLEEKQIREKLPSLIETNATVTTFSPEQITDEDIRAGCLVAVEYADLTEALASATFKAAMAAIRLANQRISKAD